MRKVIFVVALFLGNLLAFGAAAQVHTSVRWSVPVCAPPPPPARVIIVSPPPPPPRPRVVVVRPAPVVVPQPRPVVVVKPAPPAPVYVAGRPRRAAVIYR